MITHRVVRLGAGISGNTRGSQFRIIEEGNDIGSPYTCSLDGGLRTYRSKVGEERSQQRRKHRWGQDGKVCVVVRDAVAVALSLWGAGKVTVVAWNRN